MVMDKMVTMGVLFLMQIMLSNITFTLKNQRYNIRTYTYVYVLIL